METTIVTPEFRSNYVSLITPKLDKSGVLKYGVEAVFYNEAELKGMKDLCRFIAQQTWPSGIPKAFKSPFLDGNTYEKTGYENTTFCRFRSIYPVGVFNCFRTPITDETELYPGMWGRAIVICKSYSGAEAKGVSFYLKAFQKTRDGERIFVQPVEDLFPDASENLGIGDGYKF